MVGDFSRTRHYYGKWYSNTEAQEIETKLSREAPTGESHVWIDRNGNTWALSGHSDEVKKKSKNTFLEDKRKQEIKRSWRSSS